jgi:hypothetical protein
MARDGIRRAATLDRNWDAVLRRDADRAQSAEVGADVANVLDGVQALGARAP